MRSEILSTRGDLFVLRPCEDEPNCVVLEKYLNRNPAKNQNPFIHPIIRNIMQRMLTEQKNEPQEPDSIHIPLDVVRELYKQLPGVLRQTERQARNDTD